jgi:hypothetical protein
MWVRLNFRVHNLQFEEALLRTCAENPAEFQLVVEHRFLGLFALHEDFVLEVRETDGSSSWRKVKLEALKLAFLEASQNIGATETEDERAGVGGGSPPLQTEKLQTFIWPEFPWKATPVISTARRKRSKAEKSATRSSVAKEGTKRYGATQHL